MLMSAIECPAHGGKRQCVRVDEVAALPLWLKLFLKREKRVILCWIAKAVRQEVDARSHKGLIRVIDVAQGRET